MRALGAAAGKLLLRSGAAESGHAPVRLLPVRSQLRRSGVPERRQLHHRRDRAADRLHRQARRRSFRRLPTASTAAFSVPTCPASVDDAVTATAQHCEVQISEVRAARSRSAHARRHALSQALHVRRQSRAGSSADLQQPHPARSGSAGRAVAVEDDADAQRHARSARAVHDHVHERHARCRCSTCARRSLPRGLPLRRRLGAHRWCAGRADARRSRADVERSVRRRQRAPFDRAAARRRRRRERRRVREPRSGGARAHGQRAVERRHPRPCASFPMRRSIARTSPAKCSTMPIATAFRMRANADCPACVS